MFELTSSQRTVLEKNSPYLPFSLICPNYTFPQNNFPAILIGSQAPQDSILICIFCM